MVKIFVVVMVFKIFVFQATFKTSELDVRGKSTEYVISWKSKGKIRLPLHGAFLHNIKHFGYKIEIQLSKTALVIEQNNYATKTVNTYIIYDLDDMPKILYRNLTLKNCLIDATDIDELVYSSYGITFDGKDEWSFGNDSDRNDVVFGVDNSSSSHTDSCKNDFFSIR